MWVIKATPVVYYIRKAIIIFIMAKKRREFGSKRFQTTAFVEEDGDACRTRQS